MEPPRCLAPTLSHLSIPVVNGAAIPSHQRLKHGSDLTLKDAVVGEDELIGTYCHEVVRSEIANCFR